MANNFNTGGDTIVHMVTLVRIAGTEAQFTLDELEQQPLDEATVDRLHQTCQDLERVAAHALEVAREGIRRFPRRR